MNSSSFPYVALGEIRDQNPPSLLFDRVVFVVKKAEGETN